MVLAVVEGVPKAAASPSFLRGVRVVGSPYSGRVRKALTPPKSLRTSSYVLSSLSRSRAGSSGPYSMRCLRTDPETDPQRG